MELANHFNPQVSTPSLLAYSLRSSVLLRLPVERVASGLVHVAEAHLRRRSLDFAWERVRLSAVESLLPWLPSGL